MFINRPTHRKTSIETVLGMIFKNRISNVRGNILQSAELELSISQYDNSSKIRSAVKGKVNNLTLKQFMDIAECVGSTASEVMRELENKIISLRGEGYEIHYKLDKSEDDLHKSLS